MRGLIVGAMLAAGTAIAVAGPAAARDGRGYSNHDGYVVAESRFGTETVSGPVRMTRLGPQVRLPGGSWIHCRMSCSETLRAETVDFWESRGPDGLAGREFGLFDYLRPPYRHR